MIEYYFDVEDLWADFENNLGLLSLERALNISLGFMPDLREDYNELQMADLLLSGDFIREELDIMFNDLNSSH